MPRAIWSGSISFGLLNVPVKLYSAVSKQTVRFRELREKDGSRVRHKRVAEADGKEVAYDDIVKGYEFAPDQYVTLTRDELAELDPKKTRAIEIQDFVDLDEIDPIYFEHPYYLGPDKGAEKAYALLVAAMEDARKVAVARFVLRNKENLAAIRPMNGVLTMATMRFADEVTKPDDLKDDLFEEKPKKPEKRELEMAKQLIESLSTDFDADQYRDEYREELLELLEQKASGKEIVSTPSEEPEPTKAPDLMAALEESLAAVRGESDGQPATKSNGASKAPKKAAAKKPAAKKKAAASGSRRRRPRLARSSEVTVGRRKLKLTNLDKVLYPKAGFTKAAGDRLLRAGRRRDDPAPARSPDHAEALPRRGRGLPLLREALPQAPPRVGEDGDRARRPGRPDRLHPGRQQADARSGSRSWPRSSCTRRSPRHPRSRCRPSSPSTSIRARRRPSSSAAASPCASATCSASSAWSASRRPPAPRGCRSTCP